MASAVEELQFRAVRSPRAPRRSSGDTWIRVLQSACPRRRHRPASAQAPCSKLALITKEKGDGSIKRRVIIDLFRSGGNARARVPERIILPRCTDVTDSMRRLWHLRELRLAEHDPLDDIRDEDSDDSEDGMELVGADLADAYCHFGVANDELRNCLAPALEEDEILIFCAMLFGFKGAPLIMGRLSAALARLWQSMIMRDGELQLYMDDPLFGLVGPRSRRRGVLAMLLYTAAAMGVNLAYHKGERGLRLCWIGVQLELVLSSAMLLLTVPDKVIKELLAKLAAWKGKGMIAFRDLRATTGKLSWMAGIIPRIRWVVSIMYAVVASVESDIKTGVEKARASARTDKRIKEGLVAVKNIELPRIWLQAFLEQSQVWLLRKEPLVKRSPEWLVVTDASPWGLGAILAIADMDHKVFEPTAALTATVDQNLADFLGVQFGEAASQGTLEALALVLAVHVWRDKLRGSSVLIRSDSVVALAIVKKLAAGSPALNYLGACLAWDLELNSIFKLVGHHLSGFLNVEADWLSRPSKQQSEDRPESIRSMKVKTVTPDLSSWFPFPSPGAQASLWGSSTENVHSVFAHL